MAAVFRRNTQTEVRLFRLSNSHFHGPISYDVSHRPVSFQQCGRTFILDGCELAFLAHIPFLQSLDINRQAGDAMGFDAPQVRPCQEAGNNLCLGSREPLLSCMLGSRMP